MGCRTLTRIVTSTRIHRNGAADLKIIHTVSEMQAFSEEARCKGKKIGFVPTMGYLHEGHLSLVRLSRRDCDLTITSIYVNPTQFGPSEDLERYPRDLDRDHELLGRVGNEVLFYPDDDSMYPPGFQTEVRVKSLTDSLCGASRPWHFPGVTLVVAKLFNIVRPHLAYFGQKDYQQAQVLRRMTEDLNFGIQIVMGPIVRETDGLAMSSRNAYLSDEEREQAIVLSLALKKANRLYLEGDRDCSRLKETMRAVLERAPRGRVDYCEIVDAETLAPVEHIEKPSVAALAVYFGKTRLIDNHILGEEWTI